MTHGFDESKDARCVIVTAQALEQPFLVSSRVFAPACGIDEGEKCRKKMSHFDSETKHDCPDELCL